MSATNPTNPIALFEELGSLMEKQVTSLRSTYRVTLRREDLQGLVAGQFSIGRDVTGSRLFRATLTFHTPTVEARLDVRLGSPNEAAPVRRYRASETDYVWHLLSDTDSKPFTSRALAAEWGRELRELLGSLSPPSSHLGTMVTTEE